MTLADKWRKISPCSRNGNKPQPLPLSKPPPWARRERNRVPQTGIIFNLFAAGATGHPHSKMKGVNFLKCRNIILVFFMAAKGLMTFV